MEVWMSLHRARLARGLDLDDVAAATRLSPAVVRKIDEGRFHELPSGLYARAYVRAFAAAVDLPPEETLRGLQPLLPRSTACWSSGSTRSSSCSPRGAVG
jgi:cytoskeletal protein RodZ